jgi:hypothetical protein
MQKIAASRPAGFHADLWGLVFRFVLIGLSARRQYGVICVRCGPLWKGPKFDFRWRGVGESSLNKNVV